MNLGLNFSATTLAIVLLGLLGIIILKWFPMNGGMAGTMPLAASADDQWGTPYYLRYNTPVPSYLANLMPVPSNYAYALGVPSLPFSQKTASGPP